MNLRSNASHDCFRRRMDDVFETGWYHWIAESVDGPIAFAYRFGEGSFASCNDNSPQLPLLP